MQRPGICRRGLDTGLERVIPVAVVVVPVPLIGHLDDDMNNFAVIAPVHTGRRLPYGQMVLLDAGPSHEPGPAAAEGGIIGTGILYV
jgi:hypothetical protein